MIKLCTLCFEFFKTITNKEDNKNIKIVEKNQCNGVYHKKLIDSFKT
jgi:hypothetical protein